MAIAIGHHINKEIIDIYPNPVSSLLYLKDKDFLNSEIEIYNLSGQEIIFKKIKGYTTIIDFSDMSKGVYFLTLRKQERILVKKLIKL